jgi:hypothetical protein
MPQWNLSGTRNGNLELGCSVHIFNEPVNKRLEERNDPFVDRFYHSVVNHLIGLFCNTKTQLFNKLIEFL